MADNYTTVSSRQTVQVLSQTQSALAEAVTISTKPSGVIMTVIVPLVAWTDGREETYLNPPAELIEQLLAGGLIDRAVYVQSTDSSDLLAGQMQVRVTYTPQNGIEIPFTAQVLVPMSALASFAAYGAWSTSVDGSNPIAIAYAQLQKTAGA